MAQSTNDDDAIEVTQTGAGRPSEDAPTVIYKLEDFQRDPDDRDTAVGAAPLLRTRKQAPTPAAHPKPQVVRPQPMAYTHESNSTAVIDDTRGRRSRRTRPRGVRPTLMLWTLGVLVAAIVGIGIAVVVASRRLDERIRRFEEAERLAQRQTEPTTLADARKVEPPAPAPAPDTVPAPSPIAAAPGVEGEVAHAEAIATPITVPSPRSGIWARTEARVGANVQDGSVIGYRLSAADYRKLVHAQRLFEKVQANAKRDELSKMFLAKARADLSAVERRLTFVPVTANTTGTLQTMRVNAGDDLAKLEVVATIEPAAN